MSERSTIWPTEDTPLPMLTETDMTRPRDGKTKLTEDRTSENEQNTIEVQEEPKEILPNMYVSSLFVSLTPNTTYIENADGL